MNNKELFNLYTTLLASFFELDHYHDFNLCNCTLVAVYSVNLKRKSRKKTFNDATNLMHPLTVIVYTVCVCNI